MPQRPNHRRLRRAISGVVLAALAAASGVVSYGFASAQLTPAIVPTGGVAVDAGAPVLLPAPMVAHTLPSPAIPEPAPAAGSLVSAHLGCINVPIVYYHYIRVNLNPSDHLGYELSVTPPNFQAQMDWLRIAGGHPVTLQAVVAAMNGGPPLPPHPVVLTFDDGHSNFATAAVPVLLRDHFVATSFVVPGFLGTTSYMTVSQVQQVSAEGMVIGAHTVHHLNLSRIPPQVAAIEISASKAILEQMIGKPVLDFAYPYGGYDPTVMGLVQRAGFRDAVATTWGTQQCTSIRYAMHRFEVLGQDDLAAFSTEAGIPAPPRGWRDPGPPPATAAETAASVQSRY